MVPELGQGLGQLHGEAVQFQVFAVAVGLEQPLGAPGDLGAHGHELHLQHVGAELPGFVRVAEEICQAEPGIAALPGKIKARQLPGRIVRIPDDEGVCLAVDGEIAVHHGEVRQLLSGDAVQPHPQTRHTLRRDEFLVTRAILDGFEPPPAQESGAVIQPLGHVRDGQSLDHPVPQNGGVGTSMRRSTSSERRVSISRCSTTSVFL